MAADSIGGRVLSRVFDEATNASVDTFEVAVHPLGSPGWKRVYEGADGKFEVVVQSERVVIQVWSDGYAAWAGEPALDSGRSRTLDVPLRRGTLVEGVVFSSTSGAPVEGAKVYRHGFLWQGRVEVAPPAVTDSKGRFELRTDLGGPCLGVRARGFAPMVACSSGSGERSIGLDAGGEILGRLGLPDGTPARGSAWLMEARSGEVVGFWDLWLREGVDRRAVAEDGRFRFGDLPSGSYVVSARSAEGVVESRTATIAGGASREVSLLVKPLARATGTVSGLGRGESATLTVRRQSSEKDAVRQLPAVQQVANGPFQIPGISNGQYVLVAMSDQGRETVVDFEVADLQEVELEVAFRHSSRLQGRVLSRGRGVRHVSVYVRHVESTRARKAFTERDGAYSFAGLADGPHEVVVLGNRFHVGVRGDTEFDLALGAHSISGVVRADGRPWATVRMFARPLDVPDGGSWWVAWPQPAGPYVIPTVTVDGGNYRFEGLPEGRYEIVAQTPYFDDSTRDVFVNADVEGVDFHLRSTADLQPIRVVPHSGVAGEEIELSAEGGIYEGLPGYGVYLPLDERGVAAVPSRLEGADLRILVWRPTRSVTRIPRWDGGPITVHRAEQTEMD